MGQFNVRAQVPRAKLGFILGLLKMRMAVRDFWWTLRRKPLILCWKGDGKIRLDRERRRRKQRQKELEEERRLLAEAVPAPEDPAEEWWVFFLIYSNTLILMCSEGNDRMSAPCAVLCGIKHAFFDRVDYTDMLGRSRRCMKKDLPQLQKMDKQLVPSR